MPLPFRVGIDRKFVFTGRARRKEYWSFVLLCFLMGFVLGVGMVIGGYSDQEMDKASLILQLVVLIPGIAVGIRRMRDIDKSGWFILIPLYNLYLACLEGTKGPNKYGPDPKGEVSEGVNT